MSPSSNMPLGQPIPDDPTDPDPHAHDNLSDEDLEKTLAGMIAEPRPVDPQDEVEVESEPEAPADDLEEAPVEELEAETPAAPPEEPAAEETPPAAAEAPAADQAVLDEAAFRAELASRDAALELQKAHAARLAGEIGYLKKRLESKPAPTPEADGTEALAEDEDPRIARLARRLQELESRTRSEDVDGAVAAETQAVIASNPELASGELKDYLPQVVAKYESDWQAALTAQDANTARLMARAVLGAVAADARTMKAKADRERAKGLVTTKAAKTIEEKKAAAAIRSSPSSAAVPKATRKRFADLPEEEQDKLLDTLIATSGE